MPGFCPTSYRYHRRTRGFCNFPSRQSKQENSITKMTNKYIICRSFKSFWLNELSIIKENYTMPRRTRQGTCICSFFFLNTFPIIIRNLLKGSTLNYIQFCFYDMNSVNSSQFYSINKRPMGHIAHLRKQFKSIDTYDYIITLI